MAIALELDQVNFSFGDRETLKNISFKVERGAVHGLLGPNGAGKTTTMKVLVNLLEPDSGNVFVNGKSVTLEQDYGQVGFLLDNLPLYMEMSVVEFLQFLSQIRAIPKSEQEDAINYCLNALDLNDVKNRLIGNLSKGFKQRVAIAQAIIHRPLIVILDEPTLGLDPQSVIEIRNLILKLKEQHTVLVSSHLLHEMSLICDEITIISEGKVVQTGLISDLSSNINKFHTIEVLVGDVDVEKFKSLFNNIDEIESIEHMQRDLLNHFVLKISSSDKDLRPLLSNIIVRENIALYKIDRTEKTLEDMFIGYTS